MTKKYAREWKFSCAARGIRYFRQKNGLEGLKILEERPIDLAIVDVMMPVMDGITMTAKLREKIRLSGDLPFSEDREVDKILGLNIGADDYVTKPFTPMELMARVNSQLRRYHRFLDQLNSGQKENPKIHQVGGLEVNEETVEVIADGKNVKVTPIEFKHPSPFSSAIQEESSGRRNLRKSLERTGDQYRYCHGTYTQPPENRSDPKDPKYIKVVWGVGYKLEKQ